MKTIVFVWEQFGPYHIDRCSAVARKLGATHKVIGIEIAETSPNHLWDHPPAPADFLLITLFKGLATGPSKLKIGRRLLTELLHIRPSICFMCHYERPEIFAVALAIRLLGIPVITMQESKFDDKPRRLTRELLKRFFLFPYTAAIVGGRRTRSYMEFFESKAITSSRATIRCQLRELWRSPIGRQRQTAAPTRSANLSSSRAS